MKNRLLFLSCSQQKRTTPDLLPAIERYDGPAFRVVRNFRRDNFAEKSIIDIFIISAEYGILEASKEIPFYDRRLTSRRVNEIRPLIENKIKHISKENHYDDLFISASQAYLEALGTYQNYIQNNTRITLSSGSPGKKLGELRRWLYDGKSAQNGVSAPKNGKIMLKGVEITQSPEQVIEIARQALKNNPDRADQFYSWYVLVDGIRVSPKWLVSNLTGLPLGKFHTNSAIKALTHIGLEIHKNT